MKIDDFTKLHLQILGAEDTYGKHAIPADKVHHVHALDIQLVVL